MGLKRRGPHGWLTSMMFAWLPGFAHLLLAGLASVALGANQPVTLELQPIDAPSGLTDEYRALPAGRRLPSIWASFPQPFYPPELERVGVEGEVEVEFVVNRFGYVIYAKVRRARDQRLGQSVLDALAWVRPIKGASIDPSLPGRFLMPVGFSIGPKSTTFDPAVVAQISEKSAINRNLSFSKRFDLNPSYPGAERAVTLISKGMSRLEVHDTLGDPVISQMKPPGELILGYGASMRKVELLITLEHDRVVEVQSRSPKPAP